MKKKLCSGIIAFCFVSLFFTITSTPTVHASEEHQDDLTYYVYNNGETEIHYLLDERMQPYYEANGEHIYLALPLEHLKVTDENLLAELNHSMHITMARNTLAYEPAEYHDLAIESFERTMYLSDNYTYTGILKMDITKPIVRIKTSNEVKNNLLTGKKISYIIAYYSVVDETWFKYTVEDVNCSNDSGSPFDLQSGQLYPYIYYGIKKSSNLYSATISCWCTDV